MKKGRKRVINNSGTRLAVLYGHIPCRLGLCGPQEKEKKDIIEKFLNGDNSLIRQAEKILKEFKGAYPYYKLIAKNNGIINPFDYRVVEAYWLGNSLLRRVKTAHLREMMRIEFLPLGHMPAGKIDKVSTGAMAQHNFHVLTIGSVTGTLKETKASMELCRVGWGKIDKIGKNELVVTYQPLKFSKKISLGNPIQKSIKWNKGILPIINKNDWVSIHWGSAIQKLEMRQVKNIKKYTDIILKTKQY